jgi:type IV pilus assembly protein PilY1
MKSRFVRLLLLALLAFTQANTRAEDIDLFAGTAPTTAAPNLLLIIDNAANFSSNSSPASAGTCTIEGAPNTLAGTVGGIEQCALYAVVNSLTVTATASVNLGVMMYSGPNVVDYLGASSCASGSLGGCLVYPITGLTTDTKPAFLAWVKAWHTSGGSTPGQVKGSGEGTGSVMQEAWAYFAGRTGLSGKDYSLIKPGVGCGKNYILFIGNSYSSAGSPGDPNTGGPEAPLLGTLTGGSANMNAFPAATTTQKVLITNTSANSITTCGTVNFPATNQHATSGYYADEWARYMLSQSMITYTIGVLGDACQASYAWLLGSMASSGGGSFFPTRDYAALKAALEAVFSEVQSVNSVFASVSLPVSVNTQGTLLNQLFVGMFRPDGDSKPRWSGNLKQYKLGFVNGVLRTVDADGLAAISSSGSDFIAECARSYWTPVATSAGDLYWTNLTTANCLGYPASSNSPDGNVVEKGGQGYMLRAATPASRTVKTCSPVFSSCTALTDFATGNSDVTQALLDSTSSVPRDTLINWARGTNTKSEVAGSPTLTVTAMRPSAHGDVVHSRPAAVNMGTDANPKVVVFYGGNDGVLRAINGNQTVTFAVDGTNVTPGSEFWAFIPPEFYGKIKRLYDNTAIILTPTSVGGTPKDYGMDGSLVTFKTSTGDLWIYASMRRGGRALYAFKMDKTTLAVSLKWKRGCADTTDSNCTNDGNGDWRKIGQTWAAPKVVRAAGYLSGGSTAPLLVMGAGYDTTCEDAATCTTTATGNHIYVIDADTGVILKDFTTDRSVVGDVNFVPDSSGNVTFGYASDLGGNIYRISGTNANTAIGTTTPNNWTITKIASLGCATAATCTSPPNRKFLAGPEILVDTINNKHILLVGSGDREKPLNTANATSNYFFRVDDKPTVTSYLSDESSANCPGVNMMCLNSLLSVSSAAMPTTSELAAKKGWYRVLRANEQVVTASVTVFGTIRFATNEPKAVAANICKANLGVARFYEVDFATGENPNGTTDDPFVTSDAGGLPPTPVVGVTMIDGVPVPFSTGCKGSLESCQLVPPPNTLNPSKVRSYWYIQK